jgi:hypothetical protein
MKIKITATDNNGKEIITRNYVDGIVIFDSLAEFVCDARTIENEEEGWQDERNRELEADHADELAPAEDNDPVQ